MDVGVVVVAAGEGSRMNSNIRKPFLCISGIPILIHTLQIFSLHKAISQIVLVVHAKDYQKASELLSFYKISKVESIVVGGSNRTKSVYNGLLKIKTPIVLIHDAVRPFITFELISRLIKNVSKYKAVIPGVYVKDTIKEIDACFGVKDLDRRKLLAVQTPQAFLKNLLLLAYEKYFEKPFFCTDDSSLIRKLGKDVKFILGDYLNIKITTQEDLVFATSLYNTFREKIKVFEKRSLKDKL